MEKLERYRQLRIFFIFLTIFFLIISLIGLMGAISYEPEHTLGPAMAGFFYMMCSIFFLFLFIVSLCITIAISRRLTRMISGQNGVNNDIVIFIAILYFVMIIWALLNYYFIQFKDFGTGDIYIPVFSLIYSVILIIIIFNLIRKKVTWRNQLALGSIGFWIVCFSIIAMITGAESIFESLIILVIGIILTIFLSYIGKLIANSNYQRRMSKKKTIEIDKYYDELIEEELKKK